MKKMLSKVLALTLVVALGLSLVGGAFAAEPQTGTFDLESLCTDYGQPIAKAIVNLDTPIGDVTEEEVIAAFSVIVLGCDYNMYGTVLQGDQPRTITSAEISEDGKTITLGLDTSFAESTLGGTNMFHNMSDGYSVVLTENIGNLTTDLALTFGELTDPAADKWGAVPYSVEAGTYAYRWYDPAGDGYEMPEGGYPIIVWVHGSGEQGDDNNAQITANRVTAWGEAETQDIFGGAYVIAPQAYRYTGDGEDPVPADRTVAKIRGWQADSIINTIEAFIAMVGEENVNRNDIVIGGCSMGGGGTITAITGYPEYFAAAFPICPAGTISQATEAAVALLDMPIYLTHSIDDTTVNVGNSITTYNTLKGLGHDEVYLALFEHVEGNGLPEEMAAFLGHWSWMYNHNNFDGTEKHWAAEYTHTDEVTYQSTAPSDIGYETFKHWLAAQIQPEAGVYYTRDRDVMAYGETINGVTVYGIERVKATETVADYLAANPIVITVDGEEREIVDTIVGEDRTSITFVFAPAGFTEPAGSVTAEYVVTVNGEEIVYGGDESDTQDFEAKTYTTSEYTWSRTGETLTTMNARYYVVDKEAYPAPEDGYPLVVWLHGGGEVGTNNRAQISANDVHAWTEEASQDIFGGAYVLAPQNHAAAGLGAPQATMDVILQFCEDMGDVDMNRIYVGGCSYGGGSTWTMLKTYPNFFAAGFPHCGGTTLTAVDATNLVNTPIYISVSTGDGTAAGSNFISLYNQLKAAGSDVVHIGLFEHSEFDGVEYFNALPGMSEGILDHWVWVYFHEDFDGIGDDWDGQNWISSETDGTYTYDGRRVEVVDGVLTACWNTTDAEGNTVENTVVLEGETENPVDLGYTSFKAWLADQKKADEYITVNKTVEAWGEIVSGLTLTLETPVVDTESIAVKVTALVSDWTTGESSIQTLDRTVTGVTASADGKTVTIALDKGVAFDSSTTNAYQAYEVTIDGRTITDIQGVTSEVDKFDALTFNTPAYTWSGATRTTMNARAYTPDKEAYPMPEGGYPLVVWLHGGGETGTDNRIQVAANDVPAWTEAATQDIFGGAYVLAPQNHASAGEGAPAATMSVILQYIEAMGDIDATKVYVGGCSYGGIGTWQMLRNYPNFFAAGYPICCGPSGGLTDAEAASLVNTPIYMVTATGDSSGIVSGMIDAYNDITAAGGTDVHFAMFEHSVLPGLEAMIGILDHWSWIYVHNDFDATGEDHDGQMFIDTTVDGEYNDGAVVVADGVLTYTYASGEETVSISLNGKTERPADLGVETFKTWLAAQVNETPSVFKDVPGTSEYYEAVMAIYEAGVTTGTSATTYEPDASLTRAEFVTFLTRALGVTVDNAADTGFTDVAVNSWETGSIAWGVENEILLGYGDGTFGPEDPVTEEQVNLIIGRLIEQETGTAGGEVIPGATDAPATRGQAAVILAQAITMLG